MPHIQLTNKFCCIKVSKEQGAGRKEKGTRILIQNMANIGNELSS